MKKKKNIKKIEVLRKFFKNTFKLVQSSDIRRVIKSVRSSTFYIDRNKLSDLMKIKYKKGKKERKIELSNIFLSNLKVVHI